MKTGKGRITEIFNTLEKVGYIVFTFNSQKALGTGMKDFVDHLIIGHGRSIYIEVKLGRDVISKGQERTHALLAAVSAQNRLVELFIVRDETQATAIRDKILYSKDMEMIL